MAQVEEDMEYDEDCKYFLMMADECRRRNPKCVSQQVEKDRLLDIAVALAAREGQHNVIIKAIFITVLIILIIMLVIWAWKKYKKSKKKVAPKPRTAAI